MLPVGWSFRKPSGDGSPLIGRGEIWWADLADPTGSTASYRRPVVVVQGDRINDSRIATVICVPLTGNLAWAVAPTCFKIAAAGTGLDRDSVAQTTLIVAIDKDRLVERMGKISDKQLQAMFARLDIALGRAAG